MSETKKTIRRSRRTVLKSSDYGIIGFIKENKGILKMFENHKKHFTRKFPKEKDAHFFGHTYGYRMSGLIKKLSFYVELYEFLDVSRSNVETLESYVSTLAEPGANRTVKDFNLHCNALKKYLEVTDKHVFERLKLVEKIECFRLGEAIKCLNIGCNYACVVMAVSAVENKLHKLILKTNKSLYKKDFERATLGGLIELFRKDNRFKDKKYDRLKQILPDKHKPLIEMLNTYRIFSAHPKDEKISGQTAQAILTFSFLLLIDEDLET